MGANSKLIAEAIWNNPSPAFGCEFTFGTRKRTNRAGGQYRAGKISIVWGRDGESLVVLYNGDSRAEHSNAIDYIAKHHLCCDYHQAVRELAKVYGITLQYSKEELERIEQAELAREIAPFLLQELQANPTGEVAQYVEGRGYNLSEVSKWIGELSINSLNRAKQALRERGKQVTEEQLKALGLTEYNINNGLRCVIPYLHKGYVTGFVLRNITKEGNRYYYGVKGREGWCDTLTTGESLFIVEGQFDALRLMVAGVPNVLAIGGNQIDGGKIAQLCNQHGIETLCYIPDVDFDKEGNLNTATPLSAISKILGENFNEQQGYGGLYVYPIGKVEGDNSKAKVDLDEWGRGRANLREDINGGVVEWWQYALSIFEGYLIEGTKDFNPPTGAREVTKIYNQCNSTERERFIGYITNSPLKRVYTACGITTQSLRDIDQAKRERQEAERISNLTGKLSKAVQEGDIEEQRAIISKIGKVRAYQTREEWSKQIHTPFALMMEELSNRPTPTQTKWEVGNVVQGKFRRTEQIEFYPADITIFCAPTSHGKTMILMQSAVDLVRNNPNKTYLYISCEENHLQLIERALNVSLNLNGVGVQDGTRKKVLKHYTGKRSGTPYGYTEAEYTPVKQAIERGVVEFEQTIWDRLKLIHTDATAEAICSNITAVVEELERNGQEVGGVFIDYIQLLSTDADTGSRHGDLKAICKELKEVASTTELPIIVGAQLNREATSKPLDNITLSNLGEGADVERIAHDVYLLWQVDRTHLGLEYKVSERGFISPSQGNKWGWGVRMARITSEPTQGESIDAGSNERKLLKGYLYIEQLKARDGKSGGWALLPFDGASGQIGNTATAIMENTKAY